MSDKRILREFRIICDRKSRLRLLPSLRDKSGKMAWADNFVAHFRKTPNISYHDYLAVLHCDGEGGRIGFKPHPAAGCVTPGPSGSPLTASNCAAEKYTGCSIVEGGAQCTHTDTSRRSPNANFLQLGLGARLLLQALSLPACLPITPFVPRLSFSKAAPAGNQSRVLVLKEVYHKNTKSWVVPPWYRAG